MRKKKRKPTAIHIVDKYVYVCKENHVLVHETSDQFVNSFTIGYDRDALSMSSCADGFIYYVSCRSEEAMGNNMKF